jgi:hypothetical protein
MYVSGDVQYPNKSAARGKFRQLGSFSLTDVVRRPLSARLRLYERMWRQDLTIKSAVRTQVNSIVSTIGGVTHPDPEIAEFLNNNIKMLEDEHGRSWHNCLSNIQETTFWSGFSLSEVMFDLKFGSLYLQDLLTYHPTTCAIYPDRKGRITDGKPTKDGYHRSGFYQTGISPTQAEVRLPMWKTIYLGNEADYGNYYGRSLISPCYKWYRLKEALIDMMAAALDKLGDRVLYVSMPSDTLPETRLDVSTGEQKAITTLDLVREQMEASDGMPDCLFIPNQRAELKPSMGAVSLSDNVGNAFLDAIAYVDQESTKHILPFFLISDFSGNTSSDREVKERRMEMYYNMLDSYRTTLTTIILKKVMMPLVKWNFNRASAAIAPTFTRVYSDRPEDRVATMQMVKGLTENGYLNPNNPLDWDMIRQMVRLSNRAMDDEDLKFIKEILINPKQKAPGQQDQFSKKGRGAKGRPTGDRTPNTNARRPAQF